MTMPLTGKLLGPVSISPQETGTITITSGKAALRFQQGTIPDTDLLTSIYNKTSQIGAGSVKIDSGIDENQNMQFTQYEDRLFSNGRSFPWTNDSGTWADGDLTDATLTFTAQTREGVFVFTGTPVVLVATGEQVIGLEMTHDQTSAAIWSLIGKTYEYKILINKAGLREERIKGLITVSKSLNPPA